MGWPNQWALLKAKQLKRTSLTWIRRSVKVKQSVYALWVGNCRCSRGKRLFIGLPRFPATLRSDVSRRRRVARCGEAAGWSVCVCVWSSALHAHSAARPTPANSRSNPARVWGNPTALPARGKSGGRPVRWSMVSAHVLVNQPARVWSRKLVARARRIYALKSHVFVALCCWRREASDWPPGPGPHTGRTQASFTGGGLLFINALACTHRRATLNAPLFQSWERVLAYV